MSFKYIIDNEKNIVVLKAKGEISIMDVLSEIEQAIEVKRGDGITRRLVDMSGQKFIYNILDVQLFLKGMKAHSKVLGSRKMAILFDEIPDTPEFEKILAMLKLASQEIEVFTDKIQALKFLNKRSKKE